MPRLTYHISRSNTLFSLLKIRRIAALWLIITITGLSVPPAAARSGMTAARTAAWSGFFPQMWSGLNYVLGVGQRSSLPQEQQPRPQTFPARQPRTKSERESNVSNLELNVPRRLSLQSGQRLTFSATPLNDDGTAVQGLHVKWESSDQNIIFVKPDGEAQAGNPGRAQIRARVGNKQEIVQVTVAAVTIAGRDAPDAGRAELSRSTGKKDARQSAAKRLALPDGSLMEGAHGLSYPKALVQQDSPPLPAGDVGTLFEPRNAVGSPPNRFFPTASTPPAANRRGRELPGSDSYSFNVPITDLPGRGLDVSLALAYNSSIWHKMGSGNRLHFDVNKSWPAPGFRLGYGYLENQNNGSYLLVDADGTRHQMLNDSPYGQLPSYITTDGTFIRSNGFPYPTLTHSDGTQVFYGASKYASGIVTYWPTKITDRHGNYLIINYPTDAYGVQYGPRILSIIDTLGRYIRFYYDSNDNLVTITAPGYADGAERQEVRFYYETITDFTNKAKFATNVTVTNRPSSIQVIKHIYFPGTQQGYRYDYSPYGMIRQSTQLRGMTVSTNSIYETGTVNPGAQEAATTSYDYPNTTPAAGLTSAPTYSHRTDDWAGRTSVIPVTTFEIGTSVKITAPDGTISETTSDETGDTTEIKRTTQLGTTIYARTKLEWETDIYGHNRRLKRVQTTTDAYLTTAKTKTVAYTYDNYNNIDEVVEYDFNTAPDTPGAILRRTKTTYVTDSSFPDRQAYIDRGLLRLPTSVKIFAGTSSVPSSRVDYAYDGAPLTGYIDLSSSTPIEIQNYDKSYNPYEPSQTVWDWILYDPECNFGAACPPSNHYPCCPTYWGSYEEPVYNPATAKRGNVTSMTAYADAANATGAISQTIGYDITGNVVTEVANCCQQRSYTYTSAYEFAYPETEIRGTGSQQMSNTAIYDYQTGRLRSATDENNQTTILHYYPENLRLYETIRPDGGTTDIIYFSDMLFADPDATRMHSAVMTITSLDANRTIRSWRFSDGSGNLARTLGEDAGQGHTGVRYLEYDEMGRVWRVSNPYYGPYGAATAVNPTGVWTTSYFDPLGRVTMVSLPDGTAIQTAYSGTVTTETDQAGHQRRRTIDALGRLIQVDEPDVAGTLNISTTYLHDVLNNLVKITQGAEQQRYFKYDSLSRVTHERQVEHDAPHYQVDGLTGNNYWSRKIAYNSNNLVSDSWDARGIQTHLTYDGLNRVSEITYTGETTPTPAVSYTYDEARAGYFNRGRLTTVTTAATSIAPQTVQAFDYDRMGRIQSQRQIVGSTTYNLGYGYNLLGQLTSQTYPSNRVVNLAYDVAGRLQSVSDGGQTYANSLGYAAHGGMTTETLGNNAVHTMSYNNRLQVSQIKLTHGGVERQRYDYQYGAVDVDTASLDTSKNTGQVAVIDGYIDGVKQWQQRYAYDRMGRLKIGKELNADSSGTLSWRVDYSYDRWGNRYQGSGQGGVPVADTDIDKTRNRFLTVGSTLMIYDAAGNLTIDQKFRGLQYTYDANGRMRRTDAPGGFTTAVYDGIGQRVQSYDSTTNQTRHTVYDAFGWAVADYENGAWKRDYIYRGASELLLATVESGVGTRYVLPDHQGSNRVVTNETGQVTSRHDYRPFGEELGLGVMRKTEQGYGASTSLRKNFALMERDGAGGLDHTWWRKYESLAGRWTSPDPYRGSFNLSNPQSFNLYSYTGNDPVNRIDPTGLFWLLLGCYMETVVNGGEIYFTGREICAFTWIPQTPTRDNRTTCERMADDAQRIANELKEKYPKAKPAWLLQQFNKAFGTFTYGTYFSEGLLGFIDSPSSLHNSTGTKDYHGEDGFASQFQDGEGDQVHHFGAYFSAGLAGHKFMPDLHRADDREAGNMADVRLSDQARRLGDYLRKNPGKLNEVGQLIKDTICNGKDVPK